MCATGRARRAVLRWSGDELTSVNPCVEAGIHIESRDRVTEAGSMTRMACHYRMIGMAGQRTYWHRDDYAAGINEMMGSSEMVS